MKNVMNSGNLNQVWANLTIEELIRNNVDCFFISPGSRSSPLTIAAANNKKAIKYVHFDERSSAFAALGYSSATQKPCAIITTSGTAVANLFPAVIEASKKKVPLIILTADRPSELRLTGAHQTIDQVKIFGNYVRMFVDLPTPTLEIKPSFVLTTVDQALHLSNGELKGPVHINCMFREPLLSNIKNNYPKQYFVGLNNWLKSDKVFTKYIKSTQGFDLSDAEYLANKINASKTGIIVVGKLSKLRDIKAVEKLSIKLQWPIFTDVTSKFQFSQNCPNVVHNFDQILLGKNSWKVIQPDCVIHFGGRITSKRWYQFIENIMPKEYIMLLNHPLRNDPLHNVTVRIQSKIDGLINQLIGRVKSGKPNNVLKKLNVCNERIDGFLNQCTKELTEINEPLAVRLLTKLIPRDNALFLASSLSIRYVDMYADMATKNIELGSNRGASGIDGTIASAVGFSNGLNKRTTLLIGDLAFLYDLNSLSMLRNINNPITIIVLNNNGGGIFSGLPVNQFKGVFEDYFTTPHHLTFKHAALMFDLNYSNPATLDDFGVEYNISLNNKKSTLIEVKTLINENLKIIKKIQSDITKIIDSVVK